MPPSNSQTTTPTPNYQPGILSSALQTFITLSSTISRTHRHRSLLNSLLITQYLEASLSDSIPPLKRNSALRDLAQRLHLWDGDVVLQLRNDALKAIELLESYVNESLRAEVGCVRRGVGVGDAEGEGRVESIEGIRDEVKILFGKLMEGVRKRVLDGDGGEGVDALSPFVTEFLTGMEIENLDRTSPLKVVDITKFRQQVDVVMREVAALVTKGDLVGLKAKIGELKEIGVLWGGIERGTRMLLEIEGWDEGGLMSRSRASTSGLEVSYLSVEDDTEGGVSVHEGIGKVGIRGGDIKEVNMREVKAKDGKGGRYCDWGGVD